MFRLRRGTNAPWPWQSESAACSYGTRSPHKRKDSREGSYRTSSYHIFLFYAPRERALKIRPINSAKRSRWCMDLFGTDSCRGTVPMAPPRSNGPLRNADSYLDFDDILKYLKYAYDPAGGFLYHSTRSYGGRSKFSNLPSPNIRRAC
jgi:hypothetical protein